MSLHTLAGHMAAKGRNSDSMLVHMTPGEVQSLQALAKAHGTSLTINPDTGLPEANILKKLLPALAGAALNYFAPGVGTAIGGALGLGSAAGAGIAIGGITSLATGSLSRGLMAGLGAYGGAGLTGTLMDAGTGGLAEADIIGQRAAGTFPAGAEEAVAAREAALSKAGSAGFMDKASAGMSQIASKPGMYGKDLLMSGVAAASPILADAMVPTTTGMPGVPQSDAYIRQKRFDPRSQTYTDLAPVKASEWGERSFQSMAQGGIVALADGGMSRPPVTMEQMRDQYAASGGRSNYTPYAPKSMEEMNAKFPTTGGSKQAYDYLMGKGVSTLVPYTPTGEIARPYRDTMMGLPVDTSNQEYIFDPVTRTYKLNPNYVKPQTKEEKAAAAVTKAAAEKAGLTALGVQPVVGGVVSGGGGGSGPASGDRYSAPVDYSVPVSEMGTYTGYTMTDPSYATGVGMPGEYQGPTSSESGIGNPGESYGGPTSSESGVGNPGESYGGPTSSESGVGNPGESYGGPTSSESGVGNPGESQGPTSAESGVGNPGESAASDSSSGGGGCFLTTAAVEHMGQKDDGEVLTTLREFRDGYMRRNKEGSKDITWYYDNAPKIVRALDKRPDADKQYKRMYRDFILPAYRAIKEGDMKYAYELYKDCIDFAKKASGIERKKLDPRYGEKKMASGGAVPGYALGGLGALAGGGVAQSSLGSYSDGGQLLRGPGDGVSDSIPARIGKKQEARLADGEFVVPARIVSELGNGSTEAGARQLYAMMDRIQANRKKTVGKSKVAVNSRADKYLPA